MSMNNLRKSLMMLFVLGLATSVVAEKMYKWQDDKGVLHYTQTPPSNVEFEVIEVAQNDQRRGVSPRNRTTDQSRVSPAAATPQVPKTDVERYKAARNNNCDLAKRNLHTLTNVARIRIPDGAGGERLLSDKEKSEKVAVTQEQIKTFCGKANDLTKADAGTAQNNSNNP